MRTLPCIPAKMAFGAISGERFQGRGNRARWADGDDPQRLGRGLYCGDQGRHAVLMDLAGVVLQLIVLDPGVLPAAARATART